MLLIWLCLFRTINIFLPTVPILESTIVDEELFVFISFFVIEIKWWLNLFVEEGFEIEVFKKLMFLDLGSASDIT